MSDPKPFAWIVSHFLGMSVPVGSGCLVVAGETVGVATLALADQRVAAINSAVAAREREAAAKETEKTAEWPCFIDNPAARSLLRSRAAAIRALKETTK